MNLDLWPREKMIQVHSNRFLPQKDIQGHNKAIQDHVKSQKGHIWTWNAARNSSSNDFVNLGFCYIFVCFGTLFANVSTPTTTRTKKLLLGPLSRARGQKRFSQYIVVVFLANTDLISSTLMFHLLRITFLNKPLSLISVHFLRL